MQGGTFEKGAWPYIMIVRVFNRLKKNAALARLPRCHNRVLVGKETRAASGLPRALHSRLVLRLVECDSEFMLSLSSA